ncbi:MAG: DUF3488 domain-containing protein, partial [Comamonas sp.]
RKGIASTPATSARSLGLAVQQRWGQTAPELAKALAAWLLDMERLRYAPSPGAAPQAAQLRALRQRWRDLKKQAKWPPDLPAPTPPTATP